MNEVNNQNENSIDVMPDNYLVWAILTTIFCCLPIGIYAIVRSCKVEPLWRAGKKAEALEASADVKKWCTIAAIIGLVCFFIGMLRGLARA